MLRSVSIVALPFAIALGSQLSHAQATPHVTEYCAAAICDEAAIYLAAVDTLLRERNRGLDARPPRILSTVHLSPFRRSGTLSPVVDRFHREDLSPFRRVWPGTTIVDSTQAVGPDGISLKPGGILFVLAPVTWLGVDAARVRLAEYPDRINYGAERYVFLEHRDRRWRVVRVEYGWQN